MKQWERRMIEDMELAGLAKSTQKRYLAVARMLAKAHQRSPGRITQEELRRYLLHLRDERGVARGTFQVHYHGIRFLYVSTLGVKSGLFFKEGRPAQAEAASHRV